MAHRYTTAQEHAQALIRSVCDSIRDLLIEKNNDYGNSFAEPINVFTSAPAVEQIKVRIDDKLKRIQNITMGHLATIDEDTEADLIGYLVLKRVLAQMDGERKERDRHRPECCD